MLIFFFVTFSCFESLPPFLGHQYFPQFLYPFMVSFLILICSVVRSKRESNQITIPPPSPNKLTSYPISFVEQAILSSRICDL